jgi:RNase P/RNase MRP subunit p30
MRLIARKQSTAEEVFAKLRQADLLVAEGLELSAVTAAADDKTVLAQFKKAITEAYLEDLRNRHKAKRNFIKLLAAGDG